ncbi:MAG: shikimate dehydrogenase [Lachnospiraceae bacterium]|nr:shikimate dehydrogenase [Lachnospiraceae bacterium]
MNNRHGLIGGSLGHSYSKTIHEMIGKYAYDLIPLTEDEFKEFMEKREFAALNVTIPYKKQVIPYLDEIDGIAKEIGAVNTIARKDGKLIGYNTDYYGFLYSLKRCNIDITGKKVLMIGNGGAASAVKAALLSLSPRELLTIKYKVEEGCITYEEAASAHSDAEVIVNTSPVGMYPKVGITPIDLEPYNSLEACVDIIFNPDVTRFLEDGKKKGAKTVNGLYMLVAQAVYACEHFTGEAFGEELEPLIERIYKDLRKIVYNEE